MIFLNWSIIYRGANLDPILEKGKEWDIRTQEDLI
jgi:hypothetical protein